MYSVISIMWHSILLPCVWHTPYYCTARGTLHTTALHVAHSILLHCTWHTPYYCTACGTLHTTALHVALHTTALHVAHSILLHCMWHTPYYCTARGTPYYCTARGTLHTTALHVNEYISIATFWINHFCTFVSDSKLLTAWVSVVFPNALSNCLYGTNSYYYYSNTM
jgi:hypothetical protein